MLERLFSTSDKPKHVLAAGYQNRRTGADGGLAGLRGVQNFFPNTVVNHLKSKLWKQVLREVGDELFFHLLLHTSMFVLVGSNCYVQISGPPIHELVVPNQRCSDGKAKPRGRTAPALCNRSSIFYSSDSRQQFPDSFVLNQVRRPCSLVAYDLTQANRPQPANVALGGLFRQFLRYQRAESVSARQTGS